MIQINGIEITQNDIAREMQYHPASTKEEAFTAAARALLIQVALRDACLKVGLCDTVPTDPVEEEALFERLLDQAIETPNIDEDTCRRYFENNPSQFSSSPLVEARHILIAAAPEDVEGRKNAFSKANEILGILQKDISQFERLVMEFSACPSKNQGGHLGQLSKGSTVPEFESALFALEQGLAQAPVLSRYGVHIVDVRHKEPAVQLPYEAAKTKISAYLQLNSRQQATAHYLHRLLAQQDVKGFDWESSLN